jgi:hypothetical protein
MGCLPTKQARRPRSRRLSEEVCDRMGKETMAIPAAVSSIAIMGSTAIEKRR